jgi:hypothetical protein
MTTQTPLPRWMIERIAAGTMTEAECRKLLADLDASEHDEKEALAREAKRMKAKGMTHVITAWVHPSAGGDDYPVNWYVKGTLPAGWVEKQLQRKRSAVLTDYRIDAL